MVCKFENHRGVGKFIAGYPALPGLAPRPINVSEKNFFRNKNKILCLQAEVATFDSLKKLPKFYSMKTFPISIILSILLSQAIFCQEIPYTQTPNWESNKDGISTGLGLADINGDGWKDIVVANGNDILRQRLVVYYNKGDGTFPVIPDWESDDIDYNGHLAVGDVNKDGWLDVAVSVYIGENGFSGPGKVKVYYNLGGELEKTPSFESYHFYTFSCALGDFDGDGDLDLATTGGEPYSKLLDSGKVFLNNNGSFDTVPEWESSFAFGSLDVDFGDMDQNGYLDLVFTCEDTPNYIFLANSFGEVPDTAGWESTNPENFINSLDIGFVGSNNSPAFVATGNDQLGGNGEVLAYRFPAGVPDTSGPDWSSLPFGTGSGIILADVNRDNILDLVYGGWWLPMNIALGFPDGSFETETSYTSSTNSVVETIQMADLDRNDIQTVTESFQGNELKGPVVYLGKQLIENILSVQVNGVELDDSVYCYVPNKNWVSISQPIVAGDSLSIEYEYSDFNDIVISNWDSNKGNYIFYNTLATGINPNQAGPAESLEVKCSPNPFHGELKLQVYSEMNSAITIQLAGISGEILYNGNARISALETINYTIPDLNLENGVYVLTVKNRNTALTKKVVKN